MVKNRKIEVRVTRNQQERIKNNCAAKGFRFVSDYIRFLALHEDMATQQKVHEIHAHLLGDMPRTKRRKIQVK